MVRPTQISNEQILEAAERVFLEHGYTASTSLVAQEAGVSEGSIFKRFTTKEGLFIAALSRNLTAIDFEARVGQGDMEDNLREVVLQLIGHFREMLPRMMMLWAQLNPMKAMGELDVPPPIIILKKLSAYLEAEREGGRLVAQDITILARVLLASTHSFAFMECIHAGAHVSLDADQYAEEVIRLVWRGISGGAR